MEKQINGGYQMVSSRLRTTIVFFALCGLIATSAFAGVLGNNPTNFAHEIAAKVVGGVTSSNDLTFAPQVYTMGIARNQGQNFILRYTLSNGAVFGTTIIAPVYSGAPANVSIVLRSGGVGASTVEFDVNVLAAVGTFSGDTFTFNGQIRFPVPSVVGATTTLTVDVRDVISALDTVPGPYTRTLATLLGAGAVTATAGNRAIIDATAVTPLTQFVAQSTGAADDDTITIAKVAITTSRQTGAVYDAPGSTGALYTLLPGDQVLFTLTGDFSGIAQVGLNIGNHAGPIVVGGGTAANEQFTITGLTTATLTVNGDRLGTVGTPTNLASTIWFTKTAGATLSPRTFAITANITPVAASQARQLVSTSDFFGWVQNGTTMLAPYVSFTPGNGVKFRFTNSSNNAITILISVVMDQGTFTQNLASISVPAAGSQQVTFSDLPTTGTLELGPIATLLTGIQPVRGKVTFTALTASPNVAGIEMIYSPVGVVTIENLPQNPSW
jgi:hypothetical protein